MPAMLPRLVMACPPVQGQATLSNMGPASCQPNLAIAARWQSEGGSTTHSLMSQTPDDAGGLRSLQRLIAVFLQRSKVSCSAPATVLTYRTSHSMRTAGMGLHKAPKGRSGACKGARPLMRIL